jgi:hypothetical protein
MARNCYFGADATMVSGSATFSAQINADAPAFGLTNEQAVEYGAIDAQLQSAFAAATTPATRTSVTVAQKNALIKTMQRRARALSDIIRATAGVSDAQLLSLGLLPRPRRARRNAPAEPPSVRVISVVGRVVKVRVCDPQSSSGRSKAFGACGAEVFSHVGEQAPDDRRAYHFEGMTSRTTMQITFADQVRSGATVWLSARWISARGETGAASVPISFNLTGGPIVAAASVPLRAAA